MIKHKGGEKIRRQVILLIATFVFVMSLCGAVAATDSQGGANDTQTVQSLNGTNSSSNEPDPRIHGVIRNNTTLANGAVINIRNPSNNSLIISGTTNSSGEYDIYFNSSLTQFKVEILFGGRNFTTTVTPTGTPIPTAELNHTFVQTKMLKPVKMVILSTRLQAVDPLIKAYKQDLVPEGYDFELKIFDSSEVQNNPVVFQQLTEELKTANIFYMFHVNNPLSSALVPALKAMNSSTVIFQTSCSGDFSASNKTIRNLAAYSSAFSSDLSQENMKRILLHVLNATNSIPALSSSELAIIPTIKDYVYHPDTTVKFLNRTGYISWYNSTGRYDANAPWVGIVIHPWYATGNDMAVYDALIRAIESRGANVILLVSGSTPRTNSSLPFFMENGTAKIDVLITHLHTTYGVNKTDSLAFYQALNVPVLNPVHTNMLLGDYLNNSTGLSSELGSWVITPEIDGRIEPILIGGNQITGIDSETGAIIKIFAPYMPGIEQLAGRAVSWANLNVKINPTKKLALVYFDNTHDEGMPVGGGLNLAESVTNILIALSQSGYNLGSLNANNLTSADVLAMINDHGRNIVNYTQSDLAKLVQKGAITITKDEYLQMYYTLPVSLRNQVEAVWGSPIGNVMTYQGKIVLPGVMLGNIFIGPQPIWKWNGNLSSLDDDTLPPTHQYIAFYLYMQKMFDADAVVHMGQHGTLELLPGHSSGMTADDWPNTLIGDMPNIYLYNMANSGEATPAKRRAYATMISYLIPPVTETQLYGNFQELHDLIDSFETAYNNNDTERMALLKTQIWNKINNETGLSERLGINSTTGFGTVLNKLHDHLHNLQKLLTPYGLHTFGELPDNETLEKFIAAIIAFDPANRAGQHDYILNLLNQSAINEMASLMNALNGGYIPAGIARDPVRGLDALPSGRNMYSFDPRKVPDATAMIIGSQAAQAMLDRYKEANGGKYPETVGTDIRGGEVMSTSGQSIASIFYLLGVKPVYNSGVIVGTEFIPLNELGRPRIDVMVGASVSFRDTCSYLVGIIDDAIKQVALLNESTGQNYVRKHYLAMMVSLKSELKSQGLSDAEAETQSERLARARIFGLPPGADPHGVGVGRLLRSGVEWTEEDLAETYLDYNSYLYGNGLDGVPGRSVMEKLVMSVDATMVVTDRVTANLPTPLYVGSASMNFVVKHLTGKNITSYILRTGDGVPKALTIKEAVMDDLTLTLFNPVWREGMLREGYAGGANIALRIRSLFNVNYLVDVASGGIGQRVVDTYLNPNIFSQLSSDAQKSIAKTLLQASKRGAIKLTSSQAKMLAEILGVEGTVPDSGNPSTPTNPNNPSNPSTPSNPGTTPSSPSDSGSSSSVSPAVSTSASEAGDQSGKSYEVSEKTKSSAKSNDNYAYAIVGLIALMGLIGFGYFKGAGRN
jgi:cobaltochelatase CobN